MISLNLIFWALIAIAGSVVVLAVLDAVFYISSRRRRGATSSKQASSGDDGEIESEADMEVSRHRAADIIADAGEKARGLIAQAEIAGIKRSADIRLDERKMHGAYEHELRALSEELQKHLVEIGEHGSKTVIAIEKRIVELSASYEKLISQQMERVEKELKDASKKHLEGVEKMLTSMERDTASKVVEAVQRELSTSRSEVAAYRAARQRIVDDRLVDILERTVMITLSETLSLNEHSRLIYSALEKAKKELFFDKKN